MFGTPEYMSPEQAHGEDATPQSDLYSIGVIFYEMLTGRLPFLARDRDGYIESHKKSIPPSPKTFQKDIDPRAERIIMTLLEKDLTKRFRDAHHLLEEFKTLQRRIAPVSPWEIADPERRAAANPGLGILATGLNDVATWALKATIFGRMVATSYPGGGPSKVMESIESIWRLVAASTRLAGELQVQAKQNDDLQRKGRDFTAQIGRKIEDLSREQSRLRREVTAATGDLNRLKDDYNKASEELNDSRKIIASIDKGRDEMTEGLRKAYETAGFAAARRQSRAESVSKVEAKINKWNDDIERIEAQLSEYREQLEHHPSSVDSELEAGRQRLAAKSQERDSYSAALRDAADFLADHFNWHTNSIHWIIV